MSFYTIDLLDLSLYLQGKYLGLYRKSAESHRKKKKTIKIPPDVFSSTKLCSEGTQTRPLYVGFFSFLSFFFLENTFEY